MTKEQRAIYRSIDYRFVGLLIRARFWLLMRLWDKAHLAETPWVAMQAEIYKFLGGGDLYRTEATGDRGPYDDPPEYEEVDLAAL